MSVIIIGPFVFLRDRRAQTAIVVARLFPRSPCSIFSANSSTLKPVSETAFIATVRPWLHVK